MAVTLTTEYQTIATATLSNFYCTFYLDAKYVSQSTSGTGSSVIKTRLRSTKTGTTGGTGWGFDCSYCTGISGSDVWWIDNETILESPDTTVAHGSDGKLTLTLSASGHINYIGLSFAISAEAKLPDIAVIPTLSISSTTGSSSSNRAEIGSSTISLALSNTGNRSTTVYYKDGNNTARAWQTTSSDLVILNGTIPTTYLSTWTTTTRPNITFYASNSVGTSSAITVYAHIPSSYVPTVSSVTLTPVNTISAFSGLFVKGITKARVQTVGSGVAGSTISSYTPAINYSTSGTQVVGSGADWTSPNAIDGVGNIYAASAVTDSRSRSSSWVSSSAYAVIDYSIPTLTANITRCDANGNVNALGTYAKLTGTYAVSPVNDGTNDKNTITLQYSLDNETWTTITTSSFSGNISEVIGGSFARTTAYNIYVKVVDLNATTSLTKVLPTSKTLTEDYVDLTISESTEFERNTQVGDQMKVSLSGDYYNGYFDEDETIHNNLAVTWYVSLDNETWKLGGTITPTITSNSYSASNVSLTNPLYYQTRDTVYVNGTTYYTRTGSGTTEDPYVYTVKTGYVVGEEITETLYVTGTWDYLTKYYFKLTASDEIMSVVFTQYVTIGQSYFEWWRYNDTNYFNVNGEYLQNGEPLQTGGGSSVPIGTIVEWSSSTIPTGWLLCDGSAVSRTGYATLFNKIGTTYGSGDGSTTFNLPNLKGKVPVGQDTSDTSFDTLGETGGSKELQQHNHSGKFKINTSNINTVAVDVGTTYSGIRLSSGDYGTTLTTADAGTGTSGNLQPYIVLNFIIKAIEQEVSENVVDSLPIGSILEYNGSTVPDGYTQVADYSTSEIDTGQLWIDGSHIYRIVKQITSPSVSQTATNIGAITNINEITMINTTLKQSNGYYETLSVNEFSYNPSTGNAWWETLNSNMYSSSCKVVIEYTKTS